MDLSFLADATAPVSDLSALYQYGAVGLLAAIAMTSAWVLYKRSETSGEREREQMRESADRERAQFLERIHTLEDQIRVEKERGDRLETALAELNRTVRDQVMGTLTEAQRAVTDAITRMRR